MSAELSPLAALQVTNQCVAVCDLVRWTSRESAAWTTLRGSQDDVGKVIAAMLEQRNAVRIDDFGGVCKTFLCDGETYLESPPRTRQGGSVFSFTPKNRLALEGQEMARVARVAGYDLLSTGQAEWPMKAVGTTAVMAALVLSGSAVFTFSSHQLMKA